jgi:hypothetical protein
VKALERVHSAGDTLHSQVDAIVAAVRKILALSSLVLV